AAGIASSLASTFQSWTGNLATTASTYMSDNIAIPASYLTANEFDNVEQGPPETTSIYSPPHDSRMNPINISLRHNPYGYYGVDGSSLASRYFSPLSGYGSFLAPIAGSPAGSVDYFDREAPEVSETRPQMSRRASAKSDLPKLYDHPESVPLMRSLTRGSQVSASIPVSVIQDVHAIPMQYGSTFKQSIFNSCNILIGIGILALPLGFKLAGWAIGLSLFIFCLTITNYTAKILAKCLDYDEGLHTYADMGAIAFGEGARSVISLLFSLELLACATALVILVGDSLHTIFPSVSIITFKICAWIVMSPLTLMPIRYLSYFSLLGILSASYLAVILVFDGLSKPAQPGSLLDPMETDTWPPALATVPLSFGLIMAGFT
ncbi:9985_t:CDS:2, partial [Paraglomus occultum]